MTYQFKNDGQDSQARPADAGPPVIDARDISISYDDADKGGKITVVRNISLRVTAGEFLVLIGRSGCGKTSLLNAVAGLVDISSGSLEVLGGTPKAARRDVGYMFARDALMPWRTARRNVEFSLEVRGVPRTERQSRAQAALESVHLGTAANKLPWQLSQGMRQRAALARTWVSRPKLLLMDEPFAALDTQTKIDVRAEFLSLWSKYQQTVLFITHDISEALLMADRIMVIKDGGIDCEIVTDFERPRDPRELIHSPRFRLLESELSERLL